MQIWALFGSRFFQGNGWYWRGEEGKGMTLACPGRRWKERGRGTDDKGARGTIARGSYSLL